MPVKSLALSEVGIKVTLDKAIEIGKDILHFVKPGDPPDEHDAIKLLIEAGKRVKWHKEQHLPGYYELLPGETKE